MKKNTTQGLTVGEASLIVLHSDWRRGLNFRNRVILEIEGERYVSPQTLNRFVENIQDIDWGRVGKTPLVLEMYASGLDGSTVAYFRPDEPKKWEGVGRTVYAVTGFRIEGGRLIVKLGDAVRKFNRGAASPQKMLNRWKPNTEAKPGILKLNRAPKNRDPPSARGRAGTAKLLGREGG